MFQWFRPAVFYHSSSFFFFNTVQKPDVIIFDIRFTIRADDNSFDFGCGEVAVYDSDSKIIGDEGKLLREAKEVVDNLLFSCNTEDDNLCYSRIVQIAGKS